MDSMLLYMIDLFGTAIFAVSGVLLAGRLKMDPFGVIVLGSVTAIGGGTIRDMALGATPVFWITDTTYLWVIFITCLLTMILVRRPKRLAWWVLPVCDAIGLAVFVGIGVEKALAYNASGMVAVIMGVITGCGGGIFHTMAVSMGYDHSTALLAGVISTLVIRLGAIRWHLSLPTFAINR
ncbi:TPA: trimeric intracellular cation channel family protein [Vibrio parahaemolyticus]|uniref:TRIC cation channel family protein n=1 Tax=Vibrio parahaemolyticus TaxID=670 RepID=UPI0020530848|nr:TRIC cation channel family protein [Vibrio parahaemolyticus]UPR16269.1 TRIC cation channel family protein [Vibrio parahaemolyticus]UPR20108.1 TRIC cation channel family protein [Vibrio parahaemolyticus]HAV1518473.1 trimeric intracellular cation channel family protein [Vibrio parahaemolyticus]HAV1537257.1 trimeric intracellular cation channel family protein [Vibrio parahaemolyticus]